MSAAQAAELSLAGAQGQESTGFAGWRMPRVGHLPAL